MLLLGLIYCCTQARFIGFTHDHTRAANYLLPPHASARLVTYRTPRLAFVFMSFHAFIDTGTGPMRMMIRADHYLSRHAAIRLTPHALRWRWIMMKIFIRRTYHALKIWSQRVSRHAFARLAADARHGHDTRYSASAMASASYRKHYATPRAQAAHSLYLSPTTAAKLPHASRLAVLRAPPASRPRYAPI